MIALIARQAALLLALALVPSLISGGVQLKWKSDEPLAPGEVRAATARMWGDEVVWVDARSRQRYETAHIPGAVLLNEDEWDEQMPEFLEAWDGEQSVVVYCDGGTCDASHSVRERLIERMQIPNVYVLKGGWAAWQSE